MTQKKILKRQDVRERNKRKLENKVAQLAGQFAELSLFVKKQMDKPRPAVRVDKDFSDSDCGQKDHRATECARNTQRNTTCKFCRRRSHSGGTCWSKGQHNGIL